MTAQVLVQIRNNWRMSYLSSPLPPSAPWVCQGNLCLLCSEMVCQRILVHLRQCACHISNPIMSKQIYYTFYQGSSRHTGCPLLINELQISLMLPRADQRKSTCKQLHPNNYTWLINTGCLATMLWIFKVISMHDKGVWSNFQLCWRHPTRLNSDTQSQGTHATSAKGQSMMNKEWLCSAYESLWICASSHL